MSFIKDSIIVLLGAGCSKQAGIPVSADMIIDIENAIRGVDIDGEEARAWKAFQPLYYCIKSLILYGQGIGGKFGNGVNFNIETLVNTLSELEKKEEHTIYPFIGNWNIKLMEVAGRSFGNVTGLREKIISRLKAWVTIEDYSKASYYSKIYEFQKSLNFGLRVFTLNYDLCMEKHRSHSMLERGFDENSRQWEWRRFEDNENSPVDIFLYKMHGSIDWKRGANGVLTFSDEVSRVPLADLIFGTNYKFQYIDPYLFFAYEFRRYTLEAQLILTIGYGFGDEHINGMIGQALRSDPDRRILCVLITETGKEEEKKAEIAESLQVSNPGQIVICNKPAKEFMEEDLDIAKLKAVLPAEESVLEFSEENALELVKET